MKPIYFAKKTISLALIFSTLYIIYMTIKEIVFVLPQISFVGDLNTAQSLYFSLLKKAIIISVDLFVNFFYGFLLFIKPIASTKLIHLIIGVFIFISSWIIFHTTAIDSLFQSIPILTIG